MEKQTFKEKIEFFIKDIYYIIPVVLITILSYGFVITHHSINIDTLADGRYIREGGLIQQGRFGSAVIHSIFHVFEYNPFFVDFLAAFVLMISAIAYCMVFRKIVQDKFNKVVYTIFSCLFISYPLINEIFVYTPASLIIAINYLAIAVCVWLMHSYIKEKNIVYPVIATAILTISIGTYESIACVYLCLMFFVYILEIIYNDKKISFKEMILIIIKWIIPLIISIIVSKLMAKALVQIFSLGSQYAHNSDNKIANWFKEGFLKVYYRTFYDVLYLYVLMGMYYLPIAVVFLMSILNGIIGIYETIRKRNLILLFLFIGMGFTLIVLSILQGKASAYRTCQVFAIYVGTTAMLLAQSFLKANISKIIKCIVIILLFLLAFYQAKDLHHWFYLNYVRYENEKTCIIDIANNLQKNYKDGKPVYFIGGYNKSKYIVDQTYLKCEGIRFEVLKSFGLFKNSKGYFDTIPRTNVSSYINWSMRAFQEPNTELFAWLDVLGYSFNQVTKEQAREILVNKEYEQMPSYPNDGYIKEFENYVIVKI